MSSRGGSARGYHWGLGTQQIWANIRVFGNYYADTLGVWVDFVQDEMFANSLLDICRGTEATGENQVFLGTVSQLKENSWRLLSHHCLARMGCLKVAKLSINELENFTYLCFEQAFNFGPIT
jgi:hypothetical protein